MKTARRILSRLFPRQTYIATMSFYDITISVKITARDAYYARIEAEEMAEGGTLVSLTPA